MDPATPDDDQPDDQAPTLVPRRDVPPSAVSSRGTLDPNQPAPSLTGAPAAMTATGSSGHSLTATAAVFDEQTARGGAIVRVGTVVSLVAVLALQLPPNQHPTGKWVATGALLAIFFASLFALIMERRGQPMAPRHVYHLSLVITPALVLVTGHVGVMSPVCFAFIFGIYYFGLSDEKIEGWVTFGLSAIGYVTLTTLTVSHVLPNQNTLFSLADSDPTAVIAMATVVVLMFGATFWLARLSRSATLAAMQALEHAQRQIQQRDALLAEANQDLQRVLGGSRGRFTGRRIADFMVDHVIGRGAMGEVYAASHVTSDQRAAIKVLHAYMANGNNVERFFREAEITSNLDSPYIVRVFDHGLAEDQSPFLIMELLEGHDLAWHLRERRRFAIKDAVRVVADVATALSAAQDAGIVHRDVKPKNVIYDEKTDCWKILDFGVSKIRTSSGTLTHGDIIGTPGYMAPEQATNRPVDHRADVFSLGVVAYRLLTGRPAFSAHDALSTMYQVASRQPMRPSSQVRLPADLDHVLALALAKDPDRRFRSASTFAAALRDAARRELDDRFRTDAAALIVEQPWGETVKSP